MQGEAGGGLYRFPYLHSSASGSNCRSVFPATAAAVSVCCHPECLSAESDDMAAVVTGSARVNNPGPHPRGGPAATLHQRGRSFLRAASHEGLINVSISALATGAVALH